MLRVKNNNNGTWHEIYYGYFLTPELEILKPWRWNSKYVFLTLLFSVTDNCLERRYRLLNHWVHLTSLIIILVFLKQKNPNWEKDKKKSFSKKIKRKKFHSKAPLERFRLNGRTAQDFTYEAKNYTYTMPLSVSQYIYRIKSC